MQHGDLFSNRPSLKYFAGKMLSQPFKTFAAPLHNVSKFPLTQRKPKKISLSLIVHHTLNDLNYYRRPLAVWNKNEINEARCLTVKWKRNFWLQKMSVGVSNRVCLLKVPCHWWFIRGDHETYIRLYLLSPPSRANHHEGFPSLLFSHSPTTGDKLRLQLRVQYVSVASDVIYFLCLFI